VREQRKFVRVKGTKNISYKIKGSSGEMTTVAMKNISLIGISFKGKGTLEKQTLLKLNLELSKAEKPFFIEAEVVWQLCGLDDQFTTGARFKNTDSETKELLSKFIERCAKRVAEKREFVRCDSEMEVEYSFIENPNQKYKGKTLDISTGGSRLEVKNIIKQDTKLNLEFKLKGQAEFITAVVRVIWASKKNDGIFEIGVRFSDIPPQNLDKIKEFIKDYYRAS